MGESHSSKKETSPASRTSWNPVEPSCNACASSQQSASAIDLGEKGLGNAKSPLPFGDIRCRIRTTIDSRTHGEIGMIVTIGPPTLTSRRFVDSRPPRLNAGLFSVDLERIALAVTEDLTSEQECVEPTPENTDPMVWRPA
jgi:hypothetical protein